MNIFWIPIFQEVGHLEYGCYLTDAVWYYVQCAGFEGAAIAHFMLTWPYWMYPPAGLLAPHIAIPTWLLIAYPFLYRQAQLNLNVRHFWVVTRVFVLLALLAFLPSCVREPIVAFVGTWTIEVDTSSSDFPWWREVKYPKSLTIRSAGAGIQIILTDQYGSVCSSADTLLINDGRDLLFSYCSGLGTKQPEAWSAVHHAKLVGDELVGVVTSSQYLFTWRGTRDE